MQPWLQGGADNTSKRETSYRNPTGWRDMLSQMRGRCFAAYPSNT